MGKCEFLVIYDYFTLKLCGKEQVFSVTMFTYDSYTKKLQRAGMFERKI